MEEGADYMRNNGAWWWYFTMLSHGVKTEFFRSPKQSKTSEFWDGKCHEILNGGNELITDERGKRGLKMFCSWIDMNDLIRARGKCGGRWLWTDTVKPSSGESHGSRKVVQNWFVCVKLLKNCWKGRDLYWLEEFIILCRHLNYINKYEIQIINKK